MKVAPFDGAVTFTLGPWLLAAETVTERVALSTTAPPLSVARAFSVYVPAPTPDSEAVYGRCRVGADQRRAAEELDLGDRIRPRQTPLAAYEMAAGAVEAGAVRG